MTYRAALSRLAASALTLCAAGCGGGGGTTEESAAAGRPATVEYRPVAGAAGFVQKQRSGKLKKVTADWVVIDENGAEAWVPRDMVLEIRMGG